MACVLQIGAGGVGGVVAHKMAMNRGVFSRIILASRTLGKCKAIADSIRSKNLGEIEIAQVDADSVESLVNLINKYKPNLVLNVALPYQDLSIMEACLRTKTHYLDTANYEHPDSAHFEYKEQWAYDERYKKAGIFALLGSGFDPGVTNVFCAYAQKHYFDEIEEIDILDCNAGDHGYAFATNFNPEINLREVSSKARYWISGVGNSSCNEGNSSSRSHSTDLANFEAVITNKVTPAPKSAKNYESTSANTRILRESQGDSADSMESNAESIKESNNSSNSKKSLEDNIQSNLALNKDLQKDTIYRKFEREEKHFKLESNTQDLTNQSYCNGQWRDVAPLALMKEWDYREVGVKNSYLLYHEELESLIRNIKGLRRIRFFMTFGESYLTHMKCLENVGLLRVDKVEHNGMQITPIEVLKTLLPDPASLASRTKGQTHIGCYIKGRKNGVERTIYIYNICNHEDCYKEVNAQGVSYTTGVPAMIGAKLICEGKWGVGCEKNLAGANAGESNSSLTQSLRELEKSSIDRQQALSQSAFSTQPANLTQDTRIADASLPTKESMGDSEDSMESNADSSENNTVIARLDEVKSWQSINKNNPHEVRTEKGVGVERLRGEGLDFAICKNPCIQAPSTLAEKATSDSKNLTESRRSERVKNAENTESAESLKDSITSAQSQIYAKERLALNADMPQGGEEQGIDSHSGAGIWNMEQNDPDPFMQELNAQGLPYIVVEIESSGKHKVLEDGRKR